MTRVGVPDTGVRCALRAAWNGAGLVGHADDWRFGLRRGGALFASRLDCAAGCLPSISKTSVTHRRAADASSWSSLRRLQTPKSQTSEFNFFGTSRGVRPCAQSLHQHYRRLTLAVLRLFPCCPSSPAHPRTSPVRAAAREHPSRTVYFRSNTKVSATVLRLAAPCKQLPGCPKQRSTLLWRAPMLS